VPIRYRKQGRLSAPGDVNDVYKMRLVRGHRYAVLLQVPAGRDFDLFVWKPDAVDTWPIDGRCGFSCWLAAGSVKGLGQDERVVFRAGKTGVYYFHVTQFRGAGPYTLFVGVP
jgi:hypothetical protein